MKLYEKNAKKTTFKWALITAWNMGPAPIMVWGILSIAVAFLPILSVLFQQRIFEQLNLLVVTGEGQWHEVLPYLLLLGICLILLEVSQQIDIRLIYQLNYDRYNIGMSKRMMEFIQKVEQKTLLKKKVNDQYQSASHKLHQLCAFMADLFLLFTWCLRISLFLIIMVQYSVFVFVVSVIYLVFAYWASNHFSGRLAFDFAKLRTYESRCSYYEECVLDSGIAKEIRTFHNAERVVREWKREYKPIQDGEVRFAKWSSIISFLCSFGYYILVLVILIYSVFQIRDCRMGVSIFLVLFETAREMSGSILQFSDILNHFKRTIYDVGEIRQFWEQTPRKCQMSELYSQKTRSQGLQMEEGQPLLSRSEVVFEARNLCFSYNDENKVLCDLNFQICEGEIIALVGLNGSGKSTLVKLLLGQFEPTKGQLLYRGRPYREYPQGYINDDIGTFFQDYQIVHGTLKDNVGLGDWMHMEDTEQIWRALRRGGADGLARKLPKGVNTWLLRYVKREGMNLSGGEQQRVAISRAHMSDRPILIFDEPASALDPVAEMEQFKVIQRELEGRTGILISHRVGFAKMADRIFVLVDGALQEIGTHEELLKKNGVYAGFFRKQAEWYMDELREEGSV